jgi:integral membrane sensor domain MASE1
MRNAQEPTYSFVILTLILIVVNTVLAFASTKFIPGNAAGIAYIFPAVAFMILFTLWFGGYGAIAAYVGTLVGAGLLASDKLANNPAVAVLWAVAGLLQVLIPLVAVRSFEIDLTLENRRDVSLIILFGVVINNLVGAAWGAWTLGLASGDSGAMGSVFFTWFIGNVIVTILLVPLSLKIFTPKIQRSKLFVKSYWD